MLQNLALVWLMSLEEAAGAVARLLKALLVRHPQNQKDVLHALRQAVFSIVPQMKEQPDSQERVAAAVVIVSLPWVFRATRRWSPSIRHEQG